MSDVELPSRLTAPDPVMRPDVPDDAIRPSDRTGAGGKAPRTVQAALELIIDEWDKRLDQAKGHAAGVLSPVLLRTVADAIGKQTLAKQRQVLVLAALTLVVTAGVAFGAGYLCGGGDVRGMQCEDNSRGRMCYVYVKVRS